MSSEVTLSNIARAEAQPAARWPGRGFVRLYGTDGSQIATVHDKWSVCIGIAEAINSNRTMADRAINRSKARANLANVPDHLIPEAHLEADE